MKFLGGIFVICSILFLFGINDCNGEEDDAPVEKTCSKWVFDLIALVFEAVGPCLAKSFQIKNLGEIVSRTFVSCLN